MVLPVIAAGCGVLLLLGLYTPLAGAVAAIAEAWIAFSRPGNLLAPIGLICLGLSLAMIGPGRLVHRCVPFWQEADRSFEL
jgi:uncharacterized membrane protein